jgi:hypothetical protein
MTGDVRVILEARYRDLLQRQAESPFDQTVAVELSEVADALAGLVVDRGSGAT